jgi:hypothetical protein
MALYMLDWTLLIDPEVLGTLIALTFGLVFRTLR